MCTVCTNIHNTHHGYDLMYILGESAIRKIDLQVKRMLLEPIIGISNSFHSKSERKSVLEIVVEYKPVDKHDTNTHRRLATKIRNWFLSVRSKFWNGLVRPPHLISSRAQQKSSKMTQSLHDLFIHGQMVPLNNLTVRRKTEFYQSILLMSNWCHTAQQITFHISVMRPIWFDKYTVKILHWIRNFVLVECFFVPKKKCFLSKLREK